MVGLKNSLSFSDKVEDTLMDNDDYMGAEESEVSESEEEEDGELMVNEPSKNPVYNKEGILEKLEDIRWPENLDWIHKLSIDYDEDQKVDVNDDLARELAFYTQALEGTRQAFAKLQSMGLPFLRPPDYYAEMVKTDVHMMKVKGRLLVEKKRIEESEERRKARESKRISKEVQAQKLKERAKQKKEEIESVKKWRKQRQQTGYPSGGGKGKGDENEMMMGLNFDDGKAYERSKKRRPGVAPWDRTGGKGGRGGIGGKGKKGGMDKKRKSREHKDSKFGFGGRKGLKKQNTAETTNEFSTFNKGGDSRGNMKRKRK
ncbi:putative rRNA-processing protein EBP2 homolog isoform X1 [Tasmannia lanceolata]|uniref:putative rRNA-processing protein EBP2 homolog isoform X1 n=3 Tax=Tasmannia lanceolata TaxID=3420 RepID=UPI0040630126